MEAESVFNQKFLASLLDLEPSESQRVLKAVDQYTKDPSTPSLRLERLGRDGTRKRLWSIRASLDLRVLLARQGMMTVFLRAGHHDHIYEMANRSAYVAPLAGNPGLITISGQAHDINGPAGSPQPPDGKAHSAYSADGGELRSRVGRHPTGTAPADGGESSVLSHWSDAELAEAGFDERSVAILRRATINTLIDVWPDIDDASLDLVFELSEVSPEDWRQSRLLAEDGDADERFRRAIFERGPIIGLSSVLMPHEVRRLAQAPIEEWMIFLHPDQRSLVERRFNGPARVSGSAGTGKTVVALHRAAALAKRLSVPQLDLNPDTRFGSQPEARPPVLFTTFVKNLPPVLESLYERLPTTVPGAVEFINVDKLARWVCAVAGIHPEIDQRKTDSAFSKACRAIITPGSPLDRSRLTRYYLREEVTAVIKGRGIDSIDEYERIKRTGRKVPFSPSMRRQAWELREEWDRRLNAAGVVDFPDVIRQARDLARDQAQPVYQAAIIDESQDITLVGLQLILALLDGKHSQETQPQRIRTRGSHYEIPASGLSHCWNRPDSLFIVGDAAQKIYPGGYTLAQAGVNIAGNSAVLRLNYRNSHRIIKTALACTGAELVDDLGEQYARGDIRVATTRKGVKPILVRKNSFIDQVEFTAERIHQLLDNDRPDVTAHDATYMLTSGDIGVFTSTNKRAKKTAALLKDAALPCQDLAEFDGHPNKFVKIGTFHRAKGLEFKMVFLLDISADSFPTPQTDNQSPSEHAERKTLQISQLYVAMTRARDALYLLCTEEPSNIIYEALDHFEILE